MKTQPTPPTPEELAEQVEEFDAVIQPVSPAQAMTNFVDAVYSTLGERGVNEIYELSKLEP